MVFDDYCAAIMDRVAANAVRGAENDSEETAAREAALAAARKYIAGLDLVGARAAGG